MYTYITGGMYSQHSIPYKQQMSNVSAFGQQNSLGQLPSQMPITNQILVNQNQITNPNSIGAMAANPLGYIGQINQLNSVPNAAITMPPQMVHKVFACLYISNYHCHFLFLRLKFSTYFDFVDDAVRTS